MRAERVQNIGSYRHGVVVPFRIRLKYRGIYLHLFTLARTSYFCCLSRIIRQKTERDFVEINLIFKFSKLGKCERLIHRWKRIFLTVLAVWNLADFFRCFFFLLYCFSFVSRLAGSMCLCQIYRVRMCWILLLMLFSKQTELSSADEVSSTTEITKTNTEETDGELILII